MWSCGVLLFVLLCGRPPFLGETDKQIIDAVLAGKPFKKEEEWVGVSPEAVSLVNSMLKPEPYKRISVTDALKHPWFTKYFVKLELEKSKIVQYYKNILSFSYFFPLNNFPF